MVRNFRRTRLAPSPTGALHLGHARTFLLTWWMARQAGAEIIMRMEDLDAGRRKGESVHQAYDDLRWLGMDWDRGPGDADGAGFVQSNRMGMYEEALEELWRRGVAYPCACTRAEIAAAVAASVGAPQEGDAAYRYAGTCRGRGGMKGSVKEVAEAVRAETGRLPCWRVKVGDETLGFEDGIAGRQEVNVWREAGDFPVTRFDGTPAYQLACVVDDHAMGVDGVIRGDDLLASTPRQMVLYRAMGWEVPAFAHVPLVVGADGKRLAKRHGESRIAQFREAGVGAERVVGWVAWRSGQTERLRECTAREVLAGFDVEKLPRERVVIGPEDLAWLG